jgi:general stress protein YciG
MDENLRRQIAARGGRAAHEAGNAHEWNADEAAEAGRKGGQKVSRNRQHMAEIGRKGGLAAHHRTENGEENKESAEQATSPPEVKTVREAEPPQNVPAGPGSTAQTTQLQPTELLSQPDRQS